LERQGDYSPFILKRLGLWRSNSKTLNERRDCTVESKSNNVVARLGKEGSALRSGWPGLDGFTRIN